MLRFVQMLTIAAFGPSLKKNRSKNHNMAITDHMSPLRGVNSEIGRPRKFCNKSDFAIDFWRYTIMFFIQVILHLEFRTYFRDHWLPNTCFVGIPKYMWCKKIHIWFHVNMYFVFTYIYSILMQRPLNERSVWTKNLNQKWMK